MKEEKDMECCHGGMHHHGGKAHTLMLIGTLALIYGVVNYLRVLYSWYWPPYTGWIAGGVVLILFGMVKKFWMMKKCEG